MSTSFDEDPIELFENAVWKTGTTTVNKQVEGNALSSVLNIS